MKVLFKILLSMSLLGGVSSTFAAEIPTMTFATGFDSSSMLHRRFQVLYSDAFKRLGMEFKLINLPKDEALFKANLGIVDGDSSRVLELEHNPDYPNLIRVDVMIHRSFQVAFATNRRLKLANWEDIKTQNLTIAYPRGQIYTMTRLKEFQLPPSRILMGQSCEELLEWLHTGRVDLYLDNLANCWDSRQLDRFRSTQVLSVLGEDLVFPYLHKKHRNLAPRLAAALRASLADPSVHAQLAALEREAIERRGPLVEIQLYTPYDFEPFVQDRALQQGLIYDFQRYLNAMGDGLYYFSLQTTPRIPVKRLLKIRQSAIVPFVSQTWFNDESGQIFDWTVPLSPDETVIVSSRLNPINSLENSELKGKTLCGTIGLRRNDQLQKMIQDGFIKLTLTPTVGHCLTMLAHRRADFFVTGFMLVDYFLKQMALEQELHVSAPIRSFNRHILVTPKGTELLTWLNHKIEIMHKSETWQKILKTYHDVE